VLGEGRRRKGGMEGRRTTEVMWSALPMTEAMPRLTSEPARRERVCQYFLCVVCENQKGFELPRKTRWRVIASTIINMYIYTFEKKEEHLQDMQALVSVYQPLPEHPMEDPKNVCVCTLGLCRRT